MFKALSLGPLGFSGKSLQEEAALAVKYGFDGILFNIKPVSAAFSPAEFSELLAKNNLKSGGFGLPVDFRRDEEVFEKDFNALKPLCEFAKKTGNTRCATWLSPFSDTLDYKSNFEQHKKRLGKVARLFQEYSIRLGLEFVGPKTLRNGKAHEFIHTLDQLNELIKAIGTTNVGYLLDAYHWDTAGQVFGDFKKIPNQESIVLVHINDGQKGLSLDEQLDNVRELPGATGVLRINEFMKGLHDLGYDGPVAVEPFSAALKAMSVDEAVKATKAGMDKVWPK